MGSIRSNAFSVISDAVKALKGKISLLATTGNGIFFRNSSNTDQATIQYDSTLTSKFKAGASGSESEVITASTTQTISGAKTFSGGAAIAGSTSWPNTSGYIGQEVTFNGTISLTAGGATDAGSTHSLAAGRWIISIGTQWSNGGTIYTPTVKVFIDTVNGNTYGYDTSVDQRAQGSSQNFPGPTFNLSKWSSSSISLQLKVTTGASQAGSCSLIYYIICTRIG